MNLCLIVLAKKNTPIGELYLPKQSKDGSLTSQGYIDSKNIILQ